MVTQLEFNATSSTELVISWESPAPANGVIVEYEVVIPEQALSVKVPGILFFKNGEIRMKQKMLNLISIN